MSAIGYNDTLNISYIPVNSNYMGPTGGNWINWNVYANTIQAIGATGATGTTMSLNVPAGGVIQGTIGGTGALLLANSNVYIGGGGWNNGLVTGYTGAAPGYGPTVLFGVTGATGSVGIGVNAAAYGQSSNSIAVGTNAGIFNQGPGSIAIGYNAAGYTGFTGGYTGGQVAGSIAIGYQAGYQNDNTIIITAPYVLYTTSSVGAPANNITPAISYTGQYMMICTNSTTFGPYLSINYGQVFNSVNITTGANVSAGMSQDGRYVFLGNNSAGTTFYYSTNFGQTFFAMTLPTSAAWVPSTLVSYSGQYVWYLPAPAGAGSVMYSINGNTGTPPTFYTLPASSGLTSPTGYDRSGMDSTGQYIVTPWYANNSGTGIANTTVYYSANATAGNFLVFTNLSSYSATNGLPILTAGFWQGANISGNGKYVMVCSYNGAPYLTYLSSNGGALSTPSTITFSPVNELPSNSFAWANCAMSYSGQYMTIISFGSGAIYVSYNYGINWSFLYTYGGYITMSGNGNYIIATPNNQVSTYNCIIFVLYSTSSNTNNIAIGYNAGYQNQQGNTIAIGTNAGYQTQPVNSIAIGNGAGYTQDPYIYGPYEVMNTSSFTTGSAVWTVSMSSNGQYIFLGQYTGYTSSGISSNFGQLFSNVNTAIAPFNNVTIGGSIMSANGQYMMYLQASYSPVYYSANANASPLLITTTQITNIVGNGPSGTSYGNYALCMSATGQYIIFGNTSTSTAPNNYVYYCSNGGPFSTASTVTFTNLTTTYPSCGLPAAQTTAGNGLWYMSGMSSNGQYIIMPYTATSTGSQNLYYSSNGTAGPSFITFTSLPASCGVTAMNINATASVFLRNASMSGSGQYILLNVYNENMYLSTNGTTGASNVTFTCISGFNGNGLPTTAQKWGFNGVSTTGQYMFSMAWNTSSLYVSTNYGVNWVFITVPYSTMNGGCAMSADGTKIVVCANTGVANTNYSYNLQQNAVSNTIAIGYNAGYYNQPSGSFFVSTNSMRNQNNGQTSSYGLAYSAVTGEIFYSTSKSFVIDHPLDETRYLVHTCVEGPEVGVYYRGTAEITNGRCVTVTLPAYAEAIAHDFTVQVMAIQDESVTEITTASVGKVRGNRFTIYATSNCVVHWHVYGKRGQICVDPLKDSVERHGKGPYTYTTRSRPRTDG